VSGLEAILFDWGGTLSRWAEVDLEDVWRLAARHLDPDGEERLVARLIEVEARFWQRVEASQKSSRLSQVLAVATSELGVDVTEAVLEEAATHHLDAWTPHIEHDPDAVPLLTELRERGLKIALLSNTLWPPAFHDRFLERDGLVELIDARFYTSEMPHTKPHPSAFHAALEGVSVDDPAGAVFVGDRPFDDIHGAKGVGMRAVLRPNPVVPGYEAEPDAVIQRLPELLPLIDEWS
jgi:putative hydrolase of the HAD superfamily